jgi:hypothetical protein
MASDPHLIGEVSAMTYGDYLALTVEATQRSLEERLGEALALHRDLRQPRDRYATTDTFMAATSRHMAAIDAVLLRQVRRTVPTGEALVREYLHAARRLELTLSLIKARLYGEAHAIYLGWPELWATVRAQLAEHNRLERQIVDELVRYGDPMQVDALARQVLDAETHAPTRPHPRLPHTGLLSLVARRIWTVADRLWDTVEGRVIPEPVRPAPHRHDSLMAQYLVADPKFNDQAKLMEHRHPQRPDGSTGSRS